MSVNGKPAVFYCHPCIALMSFLRTGLTSSTSMSRNAIRLFHQRERTSHWCRLR